MNRTLKRVLGLTGSVVVGLAGAVTFASAAQAHHPNVEGVAECLADGSWQVTWKVAEGDWPGKPDDLTAVIAGVDPDPDFDSEISGAFSRDTTEGDNVALPDPEFGEAPIEATQVIPAGEATADLTVNAKWSNGHLDGGSGATAYKPKDDCAEKPEEPEEPETSVSYSSDCFAITITAANHNAEDLAEFTLTPSEGEPITGTPAVDEPLVETFLVVDPNSEFSVAVSANGEDLGVFEWEGPADCPKIEIAESCEGLTFDVEVPADGVETTFTVTTSEGGEHSVTLAPGESGTIEVPVESDSVTVDWSYTDGKFIQPGTFDWTKPVCDEETTPAAQEQLPETGSSMTIMISAAAALVVAAAVLFVVARRRRAAAQDW